MLCIYSFENQSSLNIITLLILVITLSMWYATSVSYFCCSLYRVFLSSCHTKPLKYNFTDESIFKSMYTYMYIL